MAPRRDEVHREDEGRAGFRAQQCRILHGSDLAAEPRVIERSYVLQDLDEALSGELAGSTASGDERRQSDLAHDLLLARSMRVRRG